MTVQEQIKLIKKNRSQTIIAIKRMQELCEKYRKCYFWNVNMDAASRRREEKLNSFYFNGDGIELSFSLRISCNNFYVSKEVYIDGVKRTMGALRKYLK